VLLRNQRAMPDWGECQAQHRVSNKSDSTVTTMGIDIGKNSFHVVGLDQRGAIVLRHLAVGAERYDLAIGRLGTRSDADLSSIRLN
jgi:hypothetical protein